MQFVYELAIRYHLSKNEQEILKYIATNISTQPKLAIREVAQGTFTSASSVFTLAKKLNFAGYSEMLFFMKDKILSKTSEHISEKTVYPEVFNLLLRQSHQEMFNQLFADVVENEGDIYILGLGFSNHIAQYIHDRLLLSHISSSVTTHFQVLFHEPEKKKLLVFVSESGMNQQLLELMEATNAYGQQTILISVENSTALSEIASMHVPVMVNPQKYLYFSPMAMLTFDQLFEKYLESRAVSNN